MRSIRLRLVGPVLLALAALILLSLGDAQAQDGPADQDEILLGAQLYAENCAVCHGPDGQGRIGATLFQDWPSIRPDLEARQIIVNGVPGSFMPAWAQSNGGPFDEAQIDALVAYILSWQTGQVFVLPTSTPRPLVTPLPEVSGDPNTGAVLYDENCAVCHGVDGLGRIGATLAKDWPSIRPDLIVKQTIARGIEGSPMPPWSQANGGPLTEKQIEDLVAFVLTLGKETGQVEPPPPTSTPEAPGAPLGRNTGLIVGAVLLVLIVVGGVAWASSRR